MSGRPYNRTVGAITAVAKTFLSQATAGQTQQFDNVSWGA